jgi:Holliday junction resolvasome RuvABC endonuclease subunit
VNVIGLDLSLTSTGIATIDGTESLTTKLRGVERLDYLLDRIQSLVIHTDGPLLVAIEGYSFGSKGRAVFNIGELGGVVRLMLFREGIPFVEVPPSNIKMYATGKGNANKDAVLVEGVKRLGLSCGNDEMDAAWMRALVLDKLGDPIVKVPESHRRALDKIVLP